MPTTPNHVEVKLLSDPGLTYPALRHQTTSSKLKTTAPNGEPTTTEVTIKFGVYVKGAPPRKDEVRCHAILLDTTAPDAKQAFLSAQAKLKQHLETLPADEAQYIKIITAGPHAVSVAFDLNRITGIKLLASTASRDPKKVPVDRFGASLLSDFAKLAAKDQDGTRYNVPAANRMEKITASDLQKKLEGRDTAAEKIPMAAAAPQAGAASTRWSQLPQRVRDDWKKLGVSEDETDLNLTTLNRAWKRAALDNHPDHALRKLAAKGNLSEAETQKEISRLTASFQEISLAKSRLEKYLRGEYDDTASHGQQKRRHHPDYDDEVLEDTARNLWEYMETYLDPMESNRTLNGKPISDYQIMEFFRNPLYAAAATYPREDGSGSVLEVFFHGYTNMMAAECGGRDGKINGFRSYFLYLLFSGDFPDIDLSVKNAKGQTIADIILMKEEEGAYWDKNTGDKARVIKVQNQLTELASGLRAITDASGAKESDLSIVLSSSQSPPKALAKKSGLFDFGTKASEAPALRALAGPLKRLQQSGFDAPQRYEALRATRAQSDPSDPYTISRTELRAPFNDKAVMDKIIADLESAIDAMQPALQTRSRAALTANSHQAPLPGAAGKPSSWQALDWFKGGKP